MCTTNPTRGMFHRFFGIGSLLLFCERLDRKWLSESLYIHLLEYTRSRKNHNVDNNLPKYFHSCCGAFMEQGVSNILAWVLLR